MEEKYNGIYFQVKVTPHSRRKQISNNEDTEVVLVLAPFSKYPKLVFDSVRVGTSKHQHITVRNPNDSRVEVQLDRLPPEKHGLIFSAVKFGVEAHEDKVIEVTWTPSKPESWHHVIRVKNSHHLRLDIAVACTSVDPQMGKKRNVKPLRGQNTYLDASLTAKKGGVKPLSHSAKKSGVKPLSHSKFEVSLRLQKSQSVNRSFRPVLSTDKLTPGYDISSEKFSTIQGNRLPPCSLPSTPTRRETYIVIQDNGESNKENVEFEQLKHRTKSANDTYEPIDLRLRKSIESEYLSSLHSVSPVLAATPHQKRANFCDENAERKFNTATSNSHPDSISLCTVGRNRVKKGSNTSSSPDSNENFLDMLNGLVFTPVSSSKQEQQQVASKFQSSSPEGSMLPPCTVSPTPVRRQTYAIPPVSELQNESPIQFPEETVIISSRIRHVHSTRSLIHRTSMISDKFNDSLEAQADVFKQESVVESGTEKWTEWQKHYFSRSEGSSKGSTGTHCESIHSSPGNNTYSTGLTPRFDKLNFSSQNSISFHSGGPADFSLFPPPTEDTDRCSTVMKKLEKMSCDSAYNTIRKELFSGDVEYMADSSDELSHLRSGTFLKSGSSYHDMNFQYPDIRCEESVSHQNSYQIDQDRTQPQVPLNVKGNTALNVRDAALWVEGSSREKLAKTSVSSNVNLDATAEDRKFITSFSLKEEKLDESKGKSAIPIKQFKKPERVECAGVFLEISPPTGQIYDTCGSTIKTQKTSQITGWSKTSVKRRNYPHVNKTQGASCQPGDKISKLTGQKRPSGDIKTSEIVRKRRILSDDSIHIQGSNIPRGTSARRTLRSSCSFAFTKLTLSKTKKQMDESVQLHNPDAVLNKLANPDLFEATATTEPFTTSSVYFDEAWMVQQEKEFTKWLNSVLTPPEELSSTTALPKVDVTELWIQSCRKQDVVPAPTREMVSSQYNTHHRLDALRKASCAFFRSQEIAQVLSKVAVHVDKKLIAIRSDRDLHLDFGLKCNVMKLLLSYNPLWLRIALEAVYGQTIPLDSNSDVQGLTKFIATRLLSDPYIVHQYSHPTVSHLFRPGYEDAMKKFTLKKFLLLVYFLDKAKEKKLISHDPCLFCKDAELKDSRQILLAFSRNLLSGVGDITKHLKSLGYVVTQGQTYLDEFEYAVNCLGTDLRDGIRLTRMMEIILQNRTLSNGLRVPAISRLQKIHNVDVALSALKGAGYVLTGNITAKDITDGHREKTLSLLWQIIYKFQEPRFVDAAMKIQKWWRHQSLRLEICHRIQARELVRLTQAATKIQVCWRSYCAQRQLKMLKEQEAVKFVARQRASIIIQKNWRMYVEHKKYKCALNSVKKIQSSYRRVKVARKEQIEFCKRHNTLRNFQAVCRGYLYRKRLENLRHTAAALKIQTWYRRQKARQKIQSLIPFIQKCIEEKHLTCAAVTIQQKFRATMLMQVQRQHFLQQKSAATVIQRRFRATVLMRFERQCFLEQKSAATAIQRRFRATLHMKKQVEWYQQQRHAAIIIQNKFRATMLMRSERQCFLEQKSAATAIQRRFLATLRMKKQVVWYQQQRHAAIIIQNIFRATVLMRSERQCFLEHKFAATAIQRRFRATLLMKKQVEWYQQQRHAAVSIQNKFRATLLMRSERQHFLEQKSAATAIQRRFRATVLMNKQVKWYKQQRHAAMIIQSKFRATMLMRSDRQHFLEQKSAATAIQRRFWATLLMKKQVEWYQQKRHAAIIIQNKFRATKLMRSERQHFLEQKSAATALQRRYRATVLMNEQVKWYQQQRRAAIIIQNKFRATMLMRSERQRFLEQKSAATAIQRRFRATLLMKKEVEWYQQQRHAAITVQQKYRAIMLMRSERQQFLETKQAATLIQRRFRATKLMKKEVQWYQLLRTAAVTIQIKFRATILMQSERENFLKMKLAAITIQKRFRARMLGQQERSYFLENKSAALVIQRWFRTCLQKKEEERCTILNSKQEEHRKHTAAATKIQAVWRGYRERKTGTQEMVAVRKRALSSIQNALPGTKLQTRYTAALFMLKKVCSGRLIWAFTELDTITQLSPEICVDIANSDTVKTVYKYLSNANRSEIDKEMSTVATKVLINLAKYENTSTSVWQVSGNVGIILNLMSAWCGKYDPLFCNCCTLLWLFAQDPAKSMRILQVPQLQQRLFHYHKQLKQKEERAQTSVKGASKVKAKCRKPVLPATKPDWSLRGACQPQTFESPLHAVSCVIKQLSII